MPSLKIVTVSSVALDDVPILSAVSGNKHKRDILASGHFRRIGRVQIGEGGCNNCAICCRPVCNSVQGLVHWR